MAQAPIMPVFTDALISDTTHLTPEEFGCYVRLLIATWRNNGKALEDDDKHLAQVCGLGVRRWRTQVRAQLQKLFTLTDTGWHQQRLEKEWKKVARRAPSVPPLKNPPLNHIQESLCVDSETPKAAPAHTGARTRANTHKKSPNINGKDKGWHDQYIDIGRKAAFKVERT